MRHWLWLTLALAAVLAPGAALAQDDEEEDASAEEAKEDSESKADAQDDEEEDASAEEAKEDSESKADAEADADVDAEVEAKLDLKKSKAKAKGKKKGKKKSKKKKAPPEDTGPGMSMGLLGGWGFQPFFHATAGARLGGNIDQVYVGGTFLYAFGETANEIDSDITRVSEYDEGNFILFGPEVGYDLEFAGLVLRPMIGLGPAIHPIEHCAGDCESDTKVRLYIAPGAAALYSLDPFFVGIDFRYNIVLALANESDPMLAATAGMWF